MNSHLSNTGTGLRAMLLMLAVAVCLVAAACGGGASSPAAPTTSTTSCSAQFSISPTGYGLAGATVHTFSSTVGCNNPSWDFGDGATGQGFVVTHTYVSAGQFTVKHTASSASTTQQVSVADVAGTWQGTMDTTPTTTFTMSLTRNGGGVSGVYADDRGGAGSVGGGVMDGRNPDSASTLKVPFVNLWVTRGGAQFNLQGGGDFYLAKFEGVTTLPDGSKPAWRMTKQ